MYTVHAYAKKPRCYAMPCKWFTKILCKDGSKENEHIN